MKTITKKECRWIVRGGTLMGTGGGADPARGAKLASEIDRICLVKIEDLEGKDKVCSLFMVGSSGNDETAGDGAMLAKETFFKREKNVAALIPVELGGGALGECLSLAKKTGLPVVDADIVGCRASPEIFLETITLKGLKRTPLVVANNKGDIAVLKDSVDPVFIERFLRNFADASGGAAYVCGYPLRVNQIKDVVGDGSVSFCLRLGRTMEENGYESVRKTYGFSVLGEGSVTAVNLKTEGGFLFGTYEIQQGADVFEVAVKNENIVCKKNRRVILTVPDLICVYDKETNQGVYNRDLKSGMRVALLGYPSLPIWRTRKGRRLFSPQTIGFKESIVLLEKFNNSTDKV